jgi:lysophospholipase L1-like esterase
MYALMCALRWFMIAALGSVVGCDASERSMQPPAVLPPAGVVGASGAAAGAAAGGAPGGGAPAPTAGVAAPPAAGVGGGAAPFPNAGSPDAGTGGNPGGGRGGGGEPEAGASAGGNGGAGGAAGAGAAFQPCPSADAPCKVLPLGDSITVGLGSSDGGGYRVPLFRKALDAGQSITYVGSQAGGPSMVDGVPFPRNHEGHSGRTIDFISGRVPEPALDDGADIILLMIGTNDMYMQPNGAPERLAELLDEIFELEPEALLVVAQLTPFPGSDTQVRSYNAAIPAIVEERAERGEHVLLVDMYTDFPASLIGDGVHPNSGGYELMADRWYEAISEFLPQAP